jgi:hypothetical protein
MLEPHSLCRDDGKRPDGLTVMPWANGRCLVWDFTCPDTLAASHLNRAVLSPGAVANDAESRKTVKYRMLAPLYSFMPVAVETLGAIGEEAFAFLQDLGRRISAVTAEPRSFQFLMQRLKRNCTTRECSVHTRNCSNITRAGRVILYLVSVSRVTRWRG